MRKKRITFFFNLFILIFIGFFLIPFISAEVTLGETPEDIWGVVIELPELIGNVTNNFYTINYTINATEVVHNNLTGLQGGSAPDEFYHLTQALYDLVVANVADWITSKWLTSSSEYLYNDSSQLYFNDTLLNETIDARAGGAAGIWTNTTDGVAEFDGNISIKNQISFQESNITVIVNETDFTIYL